MSGLLMPTHVARQVVAEKAAKQRQEPPVAFEDSERNKALIAAITSAEGRNVVQDVDTPIPDGLPEPGQWRVTLMPVRQLARTKIGNLQIVGDDLDVQNWTHQLFKVCKVGPLVYRGPAYQSFPEEIIAQCRAELAPGSLWLVDPKAPRRYKYKNVTFIVVNDDQLWSKVDPNKIDGLEFKLGAL
jgi:hypothetical protein